MIDYLEDQAVLPHVFNSLKHFLGIHDKRDLRSLFR